MPSAVSFAVDVSSGSTARGTPRSNLSLVPAKEHPIPSRSNIQPLHRWHLPRKAEPHSCRVAVRVITYKVLKPKATICGPVTSAVIYFKQLSPGVARATASFLRSYRTIRTLNARIPRRPHTTSQTPQTYFFPKKSGLLISSDKP
jgi:hypothetical protein